MLLAYVPVITAVVWFFQSRIIRLQRKVREVNSEITGAYNEGITGAKVTKTLGIEDVVTREFSAITQKMYRYSIRSSRLAAFLTPLMSIAGALAVGTVLYKGGLLVDIGVPHGLRGAKRPHHIRPRHRRAHRAACGDARKRHRGAGGHRARHGAHRRARHRKGHAGSRGKIRRRV